MKQITSIVPTFERLMAGLLPRKQLRFAMGHLPMPVAVLTAVALHAKRRLLILPTPDLADQALADAAILHPDLRLLPLVPADDEEALLTGERIGQVRDILEATGPCLIVASIHALLQPVPNPKQLAAATLTFTIGEETAFDTLAERLSTLGYRREELVVEPLT
ncbi:MAG: hypothetical protein IKZ27_01420, partial [Kiritimatiellae bacterium]|nr:hypothetical protein [Kiritimatiellia bacterium]